MNKIINFLIRTFVKVIVLMLKPSYRIFQIRKNQYVFDRNVAFVDFNGQIKLSTQRL